MVAKRTDANQKEIVAVLRDMGMSVLILSMVGKGCPDILVGYNLRSVLIEIKDGSKPPSARKLTEDEQKFFESWQGDVRVITNVTEAISLANQLRACRI